MLQSLELRPLADIPNQPGYKLRGLLKGKGQWVPLTVAVDAGGSHHLENLQGQRVNVRLFAGWKPDDIARIEAQTAALEATPKGKERKQLAAAFRSRVGWGVDGF